MKKILKFKEWILGLIGVLGMFVVFQNATIKPIAPPNSQVKVGKELLGRMNGVWITGCVMEAGGNFVGLRAVLKVDASTKTFYSGFLAYNALDCSGAPRGLFVEGQPNVGYTVATLPVSGSFSSFPVAGSPPSGGAVNILDSNGVSTLSLLNVPDNQHLWIMDSIDMAGLQLNLNWQTWSSNVYINQLFNNPANFYPNSGTQGYFQNGNPVVVLGYSRPQPGLLP